MNDALSGRQRMLVGLTLFSMFFGAGNLIFPPFLGAQAGTQTVSAALGFMVSAVGFPVLGVIAVGLAGGYRNLGNRVHPLFASIFIMVIALSIGPGLAIPRTASTSFEMISMPLFAALSVKAGSSSASWIQFGYSVLFFAGAYLMSMKPSDLTSRIGKALSPFFLFLILVLFLGAWFAPIAQPVAATAAYATEPAARGFIEGYQTMDTLAALMYGVVIAINIQALGVKSEGTLVKEMTWAGLTAGFFLIIIYAALSFVGSHTGPAFPDMKNGAEIMMAAASGNYGWMGGILTALIFFIACFCVCISLLCSISEYFHKIFPKVPYKTWLTLFALISLGLSNFGLTVIIKLSVPLLVTVYPVAMALICLGLLQAMWKALGNLKAVYPLTIFVTLVLSLTAGVEAAGFKVPVLSDAFAQLPLAAAGLGWVLPAVIAAVIGIVASRFCPCRNGCCK